MAISSRTASRVLLVAALLTGGTALIVATYAAVRGGPALPVLTLVVMELGLCGAALALRKQLLRQHPVEEPSPAPPTDPASRLKPKSRPPDSDPGSPVAS